MNRNILIQRLNSIVKTHEPEDYLSLLFSGQPGLGKTTIAIEFAKMLNKKIIIINAGELSCFKDVSSIIVNLKNDEVLFIDEIHLANKKFLSPLFTVLEEKKIHSVYKMVNNTKVVSVKIKPYVIIAATTDLQKLEIPLVDRFDFHFHFTKLDDEQMRVMAKEVCSELNLVLSEKQYNDVIDICFGNIRILKKNIFQLKKFGITQKDLVYELLDLDINGLNALEVLYVSILSTNQYSLSTISRLLKMNCDFIRDVIEPNLLNYGIIEVSNRGRKLSSKGLKFYAT